MGKELSRRYEEIAHVCHEAFRAMQDQQGDDMPSLPWMWTTREQRYAVTNGVRRIAEGMSDKDNHHWWVRDMRAQGWDYGLLKDPERKTHPNLVEWGQLPPFERKKSRVFSGIVRAMLETDD